jgi:hypothetical protein
MSFLVDSAGNSEARLGSASYFILAAIFLTAKPNCAVVQKPRIARITRMTQLGFFLFVLFVVFKMSAPGWTCQDTQWWASRATVTDDRVLFVDDLATF